MPQAALIFIFVRLEQIEPHFLIFLQEELQQAYTGAGYRNPAPAIIPFSSRGQTNQGASSISPVRRFLS
jgi:hypothetical protein